MAKQNSSNYTIRLSDSLRLKLGALADARSLVTGKSVFISQVLLESLEYGSEVFSRETGQISKLPEDVSTRLEQTVALARTIVVAADVSDGFTRLS